jgi:ubiquinone/menaquinone biosynthesis C-methylase UbiE
MAASDEEPLLDPNNTLQEYYGSLESRIGYRLVLGGTRHFGYYNEGTWWPFPINTALRRMEDSVFESLHLEKGSEVLDAGCGDGHVAITMARKGLHVQCIDLVDRHIEKAKRNVKAAGLQNVITVRKGDYHHLNFIPDESLDGVYTVETFVHATNAKAVLREFLRVLRPGGSIALYEYDHEEIKTAPSDLQVSMEKINQYAAMPANQSFTTGVLDAFIKDAGFEKVVVKDLSANIRPMLWLFFLLAYIPYLFVVFFGLEKYFINTVAGVQSYRGRKLWRYIAATARKPSVGKGQGGGVGEGKKVR